MFAKKIIYLFMVLAGLMFVGCGGGSSSADSETPPIIDGAPPSDNTPPTVDTPDTDDNLTLDDFDNAAPHSDDFISTHFSGSQNCANCHDGLTDKNGTDVSIVKAWQGTMMANAATDPLYLAKVASEVQRNPDYKAVIEDKCSRCHMPMANVEANPLSDPSIHVAMSGDGVLNPQNPHYDAAKEGVSCTLCHRIENSANLGTDSGFSGGFEINTTASGTARKIYGPYTSPLTQPMINNVQFTVEPSAHIEDSKLCASCHNLNTPIINADGILSNPVRYFPEQAVYTEWEFSDFNATRSCQSCHMPTSEGSHVISTRPDNGSLSDRPNFHQHKFLGANTFMLDIIKNNRTKLGVKADEARFDKSITDTRKFLKAYADVNINNPSFSSGTLNFEVLVTNHSGHKFPTSIPIRRAWLHVTVTNTANQEVVFESGAMKDDGQIVGVDELSGYQEHHEEITDDSQVQVYEAIMLDTAGKQTYTFLNASSYVKDNRLLPKGFKINNAPATAQVYGEALDDDDFIGGSDTVDYEVENLPDGEYQVTVTLKYQTVSYGFMQDLYKDANLTEVALMKVLESNAKIRSEDISTDTITIP